MSDETSINANESIVILPGSAIAKEVEEKNYALFNMPHVGGFKNLESCYDNFAQNLLPLEERFLTLTSNFIPVEV